MNRKSNFLFFLLLVAFTLLVVLLYINNGYSNAYINVVRYGIVPFLSYVYLSNYSITNEVKDISRENAKNFQLLFIAFYVAILGVLKCLKYYNANYEIFDLGLYENKLWRISNSTSYNKLHIALTEGHFQPLMIIWGYIYSVGGIYLCMILETVGLSLGSIFVYKLSSAYKLNRKASLLFAVIYLISPVLSFNDILGFHPDFIVLPALICAFYLAKIAKYNILWIPLIFIAGSSEPWIPLIAFFGLFLVFEYKRYCYGISVILISCVSMWTILFVILPLSSSASAGSVLLTDSPYAYLSQLDFYQLTNSFLDIRKFLTFTLLFAPFAFIPLLMPTYILLAMPELLKVFLSLEPLHYSIEGHYTLGVQAVLIVATISYVSRKYTDWALVSKNTRKILGMTLTYVVVNSALPISINFYSETGGGAFNINKYIKSLRNEVEYINRHIDVDLNQHIVGNNNFYSERIIENFNPPSMFPSAQWTDAKYIILRQSGMGSYGSQRSDIAVDAIYGTQVKSLKTNFTNVTSSKHYVLFKKMN